MLHRTLNPLRDLTLSLPRANDDDDDDDIRLVNSNVHVFRLEVRSTPVRVTESSSAIKTWLV